MKRFHQQVLFALLCMFMLVSCSESVLDLSPLGELNSENFYNSEKDFEAASLAPYSTLLNLYYDQNGRGWFQGILYPSDDVRNPQGNNDQEEFNWLPNNGHFGYIWSESYKGIMRANVILARLPEAEGFSDESNKARYEGEARFVRAYFYFILARNFGNVPVVDELITTLEDARVGNSAPGEVWDLIEADLAFARDNLPAFWESDNVGRATSYAAAGILGKVKLFRAQWENTPAKYGEAITEFERVLNGPFMLTASSGDNFSEDTENNTESVFEIQMTRGDFNPWLPTDFGLSGNQNIGAAGTGRKIFTGASCHNGECAPGANAYGYGQVHITDGLQNEFEANDPRIFHTMYLEGDDYAGTPFSATWSITGSTPAKYIRPFDPSGFPNNYNGNNERILRLADVMLMLAEAELLGNGNTARAAELINQVRDRARDNYSVIFEEEAPEGTLPPVSATLSQDEMFDALVHERRVELALECHRYDDLVRWHRAGLINIPTDIDFGNTLAQQNWDVRHLLKPVPQGELDNNQNLVQNTGY